MRRKARERIERNRGRVPLGLAFDSTVLLRSSAEAIAMYENYVPLTIVAEVKKIP